MSGSKLYLGRKVRALREAQSLTQAAFSTRVGISTSYLNQIENNQRPVSAQVLIALMEKFRLNIADVAQSDGDRLLSALSEIIPDPVFEGQTPTSQELRLIAYNAPGIVRMLLASHQAYRRSSEQLASIDHTLGLEAITVNPTPYEEVRDYFHFKDNYIHALDVVAEQIAERLDIGRGDPAAALAHRLETDHGVRVVLAERGDDTIRSFDSKSKILYLNRYLPRASRNFQMAFQIARLEMQEVIDGCLNESEFRTAEAQEICRIGLCNYFAGALILPYRRLLDAAAGIRHDLELLAAHFQASVEQVAHRLSTLQRPELKGIVFLRPDRPSRKHHQAAQRNAFSVRTFRRRLPALECARSVRASGTVSTSACGDARRRSLSQRRDRAEQGRRRLRGAPPALRDRARLRNQLCASDRLRQRSRYRQAHRLRSDRCLLPDLRTRAVPAAGAPASQCKPRDPAGSAGRPALPPRQANHQHQRSNTQR